MKLKPLLLVLGAAVVAGLYASPYFAVHQMRTAAGDEDAAKLASYVDFEALRASLKTGMQQRMLGAERNEKGEPSPAQTMGAAVAGALLGPMVDMLITPEALGRVMKGQRPATAVIGVGDSAPPTQLETRLGYEGLNRFVFSVRRQGDDEDPVDLVFRRDGLVGWKLAELRLP